MNTSYEKLSFYNTFFGGSIDGDNIVSTDFYGNKTVVGVTTKKYEETMNLLNEYYNKLVDAGIIQKEKTPEEIVKEQQDLMNNMMIQMKEMQSRLDSLQNSNHNILEEKNEYQSNSKQLDSETQYESKPVKQFNKFNRKSKADAQLSKQSNGCFG